MSRRIPMLALALVTVAAAARGDGWPQFRGPNATQTASAELPDDWAAAANHRWKVALPGRGQSSPVVAGDTVYVTANSGMQQTRLHVLAFAADTGRNKWERQFWATGQTNSHPMTCMAAATPATDGRQVFALFASCDLVCLSADGNVLWLRSLAADYPKMTNHVGRASSPVLADNVLIVPLESQGASYVLGINPTTGRTMWRVERPLEDNYATPVVARLNGRTEILVQSPSALTALDPATGKTWWTFDSEPLTTIASPAVSGDIVLGMLARGMVALRPSAGGQPAVAWQTLKLASYSPSPLVADGRVYLVKGDILTCGDVADGKVLWDVRLKGYFWASPVLAAGKVYVVNEPGTVTVARAGGKAEIIATSELGDKVLATPAVANGAAYLRTDKFLYCIAKPNKQS